MRRRTARRRRRNLTGPESFELTLGPKSSGSAFTSEAAARAAWEAHRDRLIEWHAFRLHDAGWRPEAFWHFDAGRPDLVEDDEDVMGRRPGQVAARLRWLLEHDAFLPGELEAIRARAESAFARANGDRQMAARQSYAAGAWNVLEPLTKEEKTK